MKKLFLTTLIFMFCVGMSSAATLKWDASTEADGYKIYYNDKSKLSVTTEMDIAELGLIPGVSYTISVTAYNIIGESGNSNEVVYTLPPFVPDENPSAVIHIPGPVTIIVE